MARAVECRFVGGLALADAFFNLHRWEFAVSLSSPFSFTCPQCGHSITAEVWQSINVTNDPSLREKFMSGELNRIVCPQCETATGIGDLLYHDMARKFMVYSMAPEGEALDKVSGALGEDSGYRLRTVESLNDVMEKVFIFENDLDDHFIELIKIFVMADAEEQGYEFEQIFFAGREDEAIVLECHGAEGAGNVRVPLELYEQMRDDISPMLQARGDYDMRWSRVDQAFALALMSERAGDDDGADEDGDGAYDDDGDESS